jgi:MerR family mercuric resistance operon transcriptional regulator
MPSIGEAARISGVPVETIRYYERASILPGPQRSESGHRVYDAAGITRLRLIKRCRDLGFSLSDAQGHLAEVRRKIGDLRDLEGALAELIRDCAEGNTACPALRALAGRG